MKNLGKWIIIIVAVVVVVWVLVRWILPGLRGLGGGASGGVQLNLASIIPADWAVQTGLGPAQCDFDGDGEQEQLLVYTYDPTTVENHSLVGAVIFDSQVNRVPQEPSDESPYRPALLVPYKLLPDLYTDKGQGFLGEANVQVQALPGGSPCVGREIVALGTTRGTVGSVMPNYLSIFRWGGDQTGYKGVHYVGNARIQIGSDGTVPTTGITDFTTYNRLNDRNVLCAVQPYRRLVPQGGSALVDAPLEFQTQVLGFTIDFCFGAPDDPFYPEGVVVALLRGQNPTAAGSPTGASYLTSEAKISLPDLLTSLGEEQRAAFSVLTVTNPGTLGAIPAAGYACPVQDIAATPASTPSDSWWCAREMAQVLTEVMIGGQRRHVLWTLISMANQQTIEDVLWRVERVELQ